MDNYLGIHCENPMYAICSSINSKGVWDHELLTRQKSSLTGRYTYELPHRKSSWVCTDDILEIVNVVNQRVNYWKSQAA